MLEHVYTVRSSKIRGQLEIGQTDYVTNQQGGYAFEHVHVHPTCMYVAREIPQLNARKVNWFLHRSVFQVIQSLLNTKYTDARACSILNSEYSVSSAIENCASVFIKVKESFHKQ